MTRGIEITSIETPHEDARVCHYDQLQEGVKGRFPDLLPDEPSSRVVSTEDRDAFGRCDVVKFTDYFQIRELNDQPSGD